MSSKLFFNWSLKIRKSKNLISFCNHSLQTKTKRFKQSLIEKKDSPRTMNSSENWAKMTDEELAIAAYGEGIPPEPLKDEEEDRYFFCFLIERTGNVL